MTHLPTLETQKLGPSGMIERGLDGEMLNDDLSRAHGLCHDGCVAHSLRLCDGKRLSAKIARCFPLDVINERAVRLTLEKLFILMQAA